MTVRDLIEFLRAQPSEMPVEVEVYDAVRDLRLFGPLILADVESDEVSLFARHHIEEPLLYKRSRDQYGQPTLTRMDGLAARLMLVGRKP